MSYIKSDVFADICYECDFNTKKISKQLKKLKPDSQQTSPSRIKQHIATLRRKGVLPLDSGNSVSYDEILKRSSTLYGPDGKVKQQWVKTDVDKQQFLDAFSSTISDMVKSIPTLPQHSSPTEEELDSDLATVYISNDVHFGALMWHEESEADWNVEKASKSLQSAYDYLFNCSPNSKVGIVVDLGDLMEVDDFKNMTPKSGNILSVDSRYPKILRAAYEGLIYAVNKALEKHEIVHFYNIAGK